MSTVRRLYLYTVAFASLETGLWSLIALARSASGVSQVDDRVTLLARGLSFILVSLPVFLLHWWLAQRLAAQDSAERVSGVRALFLYGTWFATLLPVSQNIFAIVNRALLVGLNLDLDRAIVGSGQSLADNLIAGALNALIAVYLFTILRGDWRATPQGLAYARVRRLYRYLWMVYGTILTVFGLGLVIRRLTVQARAAEVATQILLPNGLASLMVGITLWGLAWRVIQTSLADEREHKAQLRTVLLYLLTFVGVGVSLIASGWILSELLQSLLGEKQAVGDFIDQISDPLSIGLSFSVIWWFYGRELATEMRLVEGYQRAAMRRVYDYCLAFFGLGAGFAGVHIVFSGLLDLTIGDSSWERIVRDQLSSGLAATSVGLTVWYLSWRRAGAEAKAQDEAGDHARRSIVRKGYLYAVLLIGVLGTMFSVGALVFQILRTVLGDDVNDFLLRVTQLVKQSVLFVVLAYYHWLALRADARRAARDLSTRHAQFPVLVLDPGDGVFAEQLVVALNYQAPSLPVAVHNPEWGVPGDSMGSAKAVILPSQMVIQPAEALRLWLEAYPGNRFVVPIPEEKWVWVQDYPMPLQDQAMKVAMLIRQLAEGGGDPGDGSHSPWMLLVYIVTALVALGGTLALTQAIFEGGFG